MFGVRSVGAGQPARGDVFPARAAARRPWAATRTGMPASGVVAGMLARCDRARRLAPMPLEETALKGDLAPLVEVSAKQALTLNRAGVNTFMRTQPGAAALQGNVSFAGAAAVASIAGRSSASRGSRRSCCARSSGTRAGCSARERTDELAADLERQVWIFLSRLKQRGALVGKTPEQAFFVRTSALRRAGSAPPRRRRATSPITLRIGFAPERANEFVAYDFRYHERSMTTEVVLVPRRRNATSVRRGRRRSRRRPASRSRTGRRPRIRRTRSPQARSTAPSARIT